MWIYYDSNHSNCSSGWWFGTCLIFHNIWDSPSHWLSYFSRWLKPPTSHRFKTNDHGQLKYQITPGLPSFPGALAIAVTTLWSALREFAVVPYSGKPWCLFLRELGVKPQNGGHHHTIVIWYLGDILIRLDYRLDRWIDRQQINRYFINKKLANLTSKKNMKTREINHI